MDTLATIYLKERRFEDVRSILVEEQGMGICNDALLDHMDVIRDALKSR